MLVLLKLSIASLNANDSNVTDLVEMLTRTINQTLQQTEPEEPEDLFLININQFDSDPEDYSSETDTESVSESTASTSSLGLTSYFPSTGTDTNEILEMTTNYHNMRVNIVNLTHTVHKQQDIILQLTKKYRDLENSLKKRKVSSDKKLNELKVKNEKCRIDFNSVMNDLQIAKKLISMEKYSRHLKRKLGEFGVLGSV